MSREHTRLGDAAPLTYPEVVPGVDIPLNVVAIALRGERLESVAFCNRRALPICLLLVLLVVTVIGIDDIGKLAQVVLHVGGFDLGILQACGFELVAYASHLPHETSTMRLLAIGHLVDI